MNQKKLNNKQIQAIALLLQDKTVSEIAEILKVALNTVYNWIKKNELFNQELTKSRNAIFSEAIAGLQTGSLDAVKALKRIIKTGRKESAVVNSSKSLLEICYKMREVEDLEKRIEKLEEKLEV